LLFGLELAPPELVPPELAPPELAPPEVDGLEGLIAPLLELEPPLALLGLLLELELEPDAPLLKKSSHSERLIWPLPSLSSLLKSSCFMLWLSPEADEPPAADGECVAEDEVPPEDDGLLLLCDVEGELAPLELLFAASPAP